jgi:hypothetical protein
MSRIVLWLYGPVSHKPKIGVGVLVDPLRGFGSRLYGANISG